MHNKQILITFFLAALSIFAFRTEGGTTSKHILLISVDGLHEADLNWYVTTFPNSTLATLVKSGLQYTNARTPFPSDSFPGLIGQVTGGHAATTGIYYDDSYNKALLPPGTTNCEGTPRGTEVNYSESLDLNTARLDAGQGVFNFAHPDSILKMTSNPSTLIDKNQLPVDPATCLPVFPHSYIKVNTIFEVARAHNLRTAWSDKHPSYEILNGRSGSGVQDLFTPEINSATDDPNIADWTKDNTKTQEYDSWKVQSVLNEINGFDHTGAGPRIGAPAIFGLNFQSVSTAEKLNTSFTPQSLSKKLLGGYEFDSNGSIPGPVLRSALKFINGQLTEIVQHIDSNTIIILSAKHGQSPQNRKDLIRIDDGAVLDALNQAWKAENPNGKDLVAFAIDDDGMLVWLNYHSKKATDFAASFLSTFSGNGRGSDQAGNDTTVTFHHSGLVKIYSGAAAATFLGLSRADSRVPDVIGICHHGVVYTGGSKIAEHGGDAIEDRFVPIVVWGAGLPHKVIAQRVETTQIAPTILRLLGIDPNELKAVKIEKTQVLPGID